MLGTEGGASVDVGEALRGASRKELQLHVPSQSTLPAVVSTSPVARSSDLSLASPLHLTWSLSMQGSLIQQGLVIVPEGEPAVVTKVVVGPPLYLNCQR